MSNNTDISGVLAATLTPLGIDFSPKLEDVLPLLDFLVNRGCHGVLLLGTTGEGPSFSPTERLSLLKTALDIRHSHPGFILLAGTGTPSLDETIQLTRVAFDLNYDGVVVLPPYYFRGVSENGLFEWYSEVIQRSVPKGGFFLGYHIPQITGAPLSLELIKRLKDAFPERFAGIKDSSGDLEYAKSLGNEYGSDLVVFSGNDALFSKALSYSARGCITAMANIASPDLRKVWDGFQTGNIDKETQDRLSKMRSIMGQYAPFPPLYKALIARIYGFTHWEVRPPLISLADQTVESLISQVTNELDGFPNPGDIT